MKQKEYQFDFNNSTKHKNNKALFLEIGIVAMFCLSCITITWNVLNTTTKTPIAEKYPDIMPLPPLPPLSLPVGLPPILKENIQLTDIQQIEQIKMVDFKKYYDHMSIQYNKYKAEFKEIRTQNPDIEMQELKNITKYNLVISKHSEKKVYGIERFTPLIGYEQKNYQRTKLIEKVYEAKKQGILDKLTDKELSEFNFIYRLYLINPSATLDLAAEDYIQYMKIISE